MGGIFGDIFGGLGGGFDFGGMFGGGGGKGGPDWKKSWDIGASGDGRGIGDWGGDIGEWFDDSVYSDIVRGEKPGSLVDLRSIVQSGIAPGTMHLMDLAKGNITDIMRNKYKDPTLEASLDKQWGNMEEEMSRRLGPDWAASTAGIQGASEFGKAASEARFGAGQEAMDNYFKMYGGLEQILADLAKSRLESEGSRDEAYMRAVSDTLTGLLG